MDTEIKLKGDKIIEQIPSIKDKALRINLNENIYGTFAEIGAGQETVRHFFRCLRRSVSCQPAGPLARRRECPGVATLSLNREWEQK